MQSYIYYLSYSFPNFNFDIFVQTTIDNRETHISKSLVGII